MEDAAGKTPPPLEERLTAIEARLLTLEIVVGHNVSNGLIQPKPLPGDADGGDVTPLENQ
jgi:hypothetical protein